MTTSTLIGLINNAALLMALAVIYDVINFKLPGQKENLSKLIQGAVLGIFGVCILMISWEFVPGVIFDARSILLCITGIFFGAVPTVTAVSIIGGYRLFIGGTGALTGFAVIVSSGAVGLAWHYWKRKELDAISTKDLYLAGLATHLVMLLWMFTLPRSTAIGALSKISLPVVLVFPLGTVLLGRLMINRLERIKAFKTLEESEDRMLQIVENMPVMMNALDENLNVIVWNRECERVTGFSADEIVGNPNSLELLYPDASYREKMFLEIANMGVDFRNKELKIACKDGSEKTISWSNISGRFPVAGWRAWAIGIDISELKDTEEKYRLLVETANEAIFIAQDEHIKFPNPKTMEMIGYTEEELLDIPFINLVHPEDREMVIERYIQRIKGENPPSSYSFRIINKHGDNVWVQISTALTKWEGRPATINLIRDITEQRELEAQLRHSQKMESIGTLAGGVAHEFNNMLGVIIGNAELAAEDIPEWNPAADCIREIRAASLRAKDVVSKLMSAARKAPASRKPLQISAVVRESLDFLRKTIPATIDIRPDIRCESEMILGDPTEINQVLMNLCANSAHAMAEKPGLLEVGLETVSLKSGMAEHCGGLNGADHVKLTVKDTGEGIAPENMSRIFDPYFTTKEIDEGIGMGMAVVHGIVKKHEGAITVKSEKGKGTLVEVLFPLIDAGPEEEFAKPETLPPGTERILFVDDEYSLVKMVTQMLERTGYEVTGKTVSIDALNVFREEPGRFDLVITDMAMPIMSGDRLVREMFRIRPDLPVILCTGYSDRIDEKKARELGIAAFVMKPLVKPDLTKTVRKVLDEARLQS